MVDKSVIVFNELDPSLKNTHVRNVLINVLLRDGRVEYALNVLDEMLQPLSEVPPNNITGDIIFYGFEKRERKGRNLSEEDTIKLVLNFGKHSVFPKTNWLSQFISRLCRSGKINQAWNVLHELLRLRAPLETPPFNVLLTGLGRSGDVKRMNTVLAEMKESDIQPNVVTFGILINQLWRQEEGLHLMERMRSMKWLAPNTVTYNSLIDGFYKVGEIERGKKLFDQMNEEGVSPNVITLNILVDARADMGGSIVHLSSSVVDLFVQMLRSGCSPDAIVYYSLISGLCKAGRMDDASNVLSKLKEAGFHPDIVCYNALVSGFCEKNKIDKAYEIIKEMEEAGMKPDSVSYNTSIAYFCKIGDSALARRVMKLMITEGIVPTIATYGALIHAYCLNQNIMEAMKLFNDISSYQRFHQTP
ncbi:hypothetical protein CRYUN_Cryun23aG0134100 [Craigia yunnanensis]